MASRRLHETLQEVIALGGSAITITALYYLFVSTAQAPPAGASLRIPVKDMLAIKPGDEVPGLLLQQPPQARLAAGEAGGRQQLN